MMLITVICSSSEYMTVTDLLLADLLLGLQHLLSRSHRILSPLLVFAGFGLDFLFGVYTIHLTTRIQIPVSPHSPHSLHLTHFFGLEEHLGQECAMFNCSSCYLLVRFANC